MARCGNCTRVQRLVKKQKSPPGAKGVQGGASDVTYGILCLGDFLPTPLSRHYGEPRPRWAAVHLGRLSASNALMSLLPTPAPRFSPPFEDISYADERLRNHMLVFI